MAVGRGKYRRVIDLYVAGTELELAGDEVMWLQVLNPFERDEARHDAAAARARTVLALKEPDSDEIMEVRGLFDAEGHAGAVGRLVEARQPEAYTRVVDEMRTEEEWREIFDLLQREDALTTVASLAEQEAVMAAGERFLVELNARLTQQSEVDRQSLAGLDEESLWDEYRDWWIDRRGGEVGLAEYRLTEMWLSARVCEGVKQSDGWDHSKCEGHYERVFVDKAEVRSLPEGLQGEIIRALTQMDLGEREAKNSARQGSSFASSPLPSEAEESTRSTPAAPSVTAPGPWQ